MNFIQRMILPMFRTQAQRHLLYGRRRRALALFTIIHKWSPVPENSFNLALCYMNQCEYERAIAILDPIFEQLPDQLFAGVTFGQCLLLAKRFEDAKSVYNRLLDTHPDNNLLKGLLSLVSDPVVRDKFSSSLDLQLRASLLQELKQDREALDLLQKAVGLTPDDAALHNNIGALKLKLRYPLQEVMADLMKAMHLSPDNDRYKRNYRKVWQRSQK